ncbi:MAG: VanZ family protein [Candidatus Omnitrophica bacterium]|nr:VanZ family protein [Candidatus Omnitrophota bacterium]
MRARQALLLWGPVAAYAAFIFWLSSAPRKIPGIEIFPWLDKPVHAVEYGPLGWFLSRAFRRSLPTPSWGAIQGFAFLGAIAVGSADEFLQRFVDERISSLWDLAADSAGSALGQRFYRLFRSRVPNTP